MRCRAWRWFPFLAVIVLAACGEGRQPGPGRGALASVPGPVTRGLRLTARLEPMHGLIRYDIENVSDASIPYVDLYVGYFEGVGLEARPVGASTWTALPRREEAQRVRTGMGPSRRNETQVGPGEKMHCPSWTISVDQRRFGSDGPRPGLEVPPAPEAFVLDLRDFTWPAVWGDLRRFSLELRVTQYFVDWMDFDVDRGWTGPLSSAVLRLDLADVPDPVLPGG